MREEYLNINQHTNNYINKDGTTRPATQTADHAPQYNRWSREPAIESLAEKEMKALVCRILIRD
jgi:hypothetical protein